MQQTLLDPQLCHETDMQQMHVWMQQMHVWMQQTPLDPHCRSRHGSNSSPSVKCLYDAAVGMEVVTRVLRSWARAGLPRSRA